jgi:hypothetical protein
VGWCKKSSSYGVTYHDAPESMIDCVISCAEAFIAIKIAIFNRILFWSCVLFRIGISPSLSSLIASGMFIYCMPIGVFLEYLHWKAILPVITNDLLKSECSSSALANSCSSILENNLILFGYREFCIVKTYL